MYQVFNLNNMVTHATGETLVQFRVDKLPDGSWPATHWDWRSFNQSPDMGADEVATDHWASYRASLSFNSDCDKSYVLKNTSIYI